ncbi:MAG: hypothetical protein K0R38_895 [Polyangiaceae bacterium]|nr:hypothetical protein [Polyangiaceae bacterium]
MPSFASNSATRRCDLPRKRARAHASARTTSPDSGAGRRSRAAHEDCSANNWLDTRPVPPLSRHSHTLSRSKLLLRRVARGASAHRAGTTSPDFGASRSRSAPEDRSVRTGETSARRALGTRQTPGAITSPMAMKTPLTNLGQSPKLVTAAGLREPGGSRLPRMYWVVFGLSAVVSGLWARSPSGRW